MFPRKIFRESTEETREKVELTNDIPGFDPIDTIFPLRRYDRRPLTK
jgi:hypothetical protein